MREEDIHIHLTPSYRREIEEKAEKKLIEEFLQSHEDLRDFVLNAPILSGDVYILKDYLCNIRDRIKVEIEKWKQRLKEVGL